jgi:hypothetical protein
LKRLTMSELLWWSERCHELARELGVSGARTPGRDIGSAETDGFRWANERQ